MFFAAVRTVRSWPAAVTSYTAVPVMIAMQPKVRVVKSLFGVIFRYRVRPERMLSIQVTKAPADFPFKQQVAGMWTVLYFQPTADGKTTLRIVGLGFADDADSSRMKAFFERGNAYTLNRLQQRFRP